MKIRFWCYLVALAAALISGFITMSILSMLTDLVAIAAVAAFAVGFIVFFVVEATFQARAEDELYNDFLREEC